jgi:hypothetical protein
MEFIKDIAAIVGCIVSIITLLTLTTKHGRNFIIKLFKKHTRELVETNEKQNKAINDINDTLNIILQKLDVLEEASKQECRDVIKNIYYKYYMTKKIPLYERKTADKTYELYTNQLKGNSYATLLYSEICKWEIDTLVDKDLAED